MASAGYLAHVRELARQASGNLRCAVAAVNESGMHSLPSAVESARTHASSDVVAKVIVEAWPALSHISDVLVEVGSYPGEAVEVALAVVTREEQCSGVSSS